MAVSFAAACSRPSKPANPGCCDTASTLDAGTRSCCHEVDSGRADPIAAESPSDNVPKEGMSAAVAEERFLASEGGARDLRLKGPIDRSLAELGRLCAPGMTPVADAVRAAEPAGGALETSFSVGARPICFRIGAVA